MTEHPPIHAICYGDAGAGKSTFISTWPKPLLVFHFDGLNKEVPYTSRSASQPQEDIDGLGTGRVWCYDKKGEVSICIEQYRDGDLTRPEAYLRFMKRLSYFGPEEYKQWKTVAIDSVSMLELAARKTDQYILNPHTKEPRQWFAGSTDKMEELLFGRFAALPMNVVMACHVDKDKDEFNGMFLRNVSLPGRMKRDLTKQYSELYRSYVERGDDGKLVYLLQTRADNLWHATSSYVQAPDPCAPVYEALWIGPYTTWAVGRLGKGSEGL